jgi:hypothetical protein
MQPMTISSPLTSFGINHEQGLALIASPYKLPLENLRRNAHPVRRKYRRLMG